MSSYVYCLQPECGRRPLLSGAPACYSLPLIFLSVVHFLCRCSPLYFFSYPACPEALRRCLVQRNAAEAARQTLTLPVPSSVLYIYTRPGSSRNLLDETASTIPTSGPETRSSVSYSGGQSYSYKVSPLRN
jgi:hypothetical protein